MKKSKQLNPKMISTIYVLMLISLNLALLYSVPTNYTSSNTLLSVLSIIVVLWSEEKKLLVNVFVRINLFIVIIVNLISSILAIYLNVGFLLKLQIGSLMMVLALLTVEVLFRLFNNQINGDTFLMMKKVRKFIKKLESEFSLTDLKQLISYISKWLEEHHSKIKKVSEFDEISDTVFKVSGILTANYYAINTCEENSAEMLKEFEVFFLECYKISSRLNYSIKMTNSLIKHIRNSYQKNSVPLLLLFTSLSKQITEMELQNTNKNSKSINECASIIEFFKFVQISYQKNNLSSNIIVEHIDSLMLQFRKYSFNLSDKVTIFILQEYIRTIIIINDYEDRLTSIDDLKNIIGVLHSECIPRNLTLFYEASIQTMLVSTDNKADDIQKHYDIFMIIYKNNYDKSILNHLVSSCEKLVDNECSLESAKKYVEMLLYLDKEMKYSHGIDFVLSFSELKNGDLDEIKDIIRKVFGRYLKSEEGAKYLLYSISNFISDENIDYMISVLTVILENINYKIVNPERVSYIQVFSEFYSIISKELISNTELSKERFAKITDCAVEFTREAESTEVSEKIISLLSEYLNNEITRKLVINQLFNLGFKAIESGNDTVYKSVSHSVGWHLFNLLKSESNVSENLATIKHVFRKFVEFFNLIVNFREKDSIFVGTVFVVNFSFIEKIILESKNKPVVLGKYADVKTYFANEVKEKLSDVHIRIIINSSIIRKHSIGEYFECSNLSPKKLVDQAMKEFLEH